MKMHKYEDMSLLTSNLVKSVHYFSSLKSPPGSAFFLRFFFFTRMVTRSQGISL